jgi:transketolase
MGDGECAEGSVWEAVELASKYKLNNLVGIVDVNRLGQSDQTLLGHDMATYHARFSAFGWEAIIVDGHNMTEILAAFERAQTVADKPVMILAQTFKGHGLPESDNKENMHGKPFTKDELPAVLEHFPDAPELVASKVITKLSPLPRPKITVSKTTENYSKMLSTKMMATRKAFGLALQDAGSAESSVVALDADVKNSTYTDIFEKKHADRFFECWIAEQAMMSIATGFQLRGYIPFSATFSSFLSRAYDQIRMAGVGKNALRIMGSHAGVSIGQDGPSQMGLEDIALLRAVPESVVLYPSDSVSTFALVELMANYYEGVSYIRTTRAETPHLYDEKTTFKIGGSHILRESKNDVAVIVAAGITLHEALKAHARLAAEGISVAVIDAYSIKPLDVVTIVRVAKTSQNRIITVEDHYQAGGLGEAVAAAVVGQGVACTILAVPGVSRSGKPEELLADAHIDAAAIIRAVKAQNRAKNS